MILFLKCSPHPCPPVFEAVTQAVGGRPRSPASRSAPASSRRRGQRRRGRGAGGGRRAPGSLARPERSSPGPEPRRPGFRPCAPPAPGARSRGPGLGTTRRRHRLSAELRGGAAGSSAARPAGGDGRGTDRRAAGAAASRHRARLPRAPSRPRAARAAGQRAACRWRPCPPRSAPIRPRSGVEAPGKMVSWMISRAVVLLFGMLYPAYYSYKAVKTKNVKEYVRWMMYWIVFALYTVIETIADQTVAWFPLYYELKIAFVIWLLSPYTKGASLIYRKFLHPLLSSKEREIDDYIVQAKERGYETMVNFGRQGLNLAATAAVTAAVKSQGAITERLRSFSMHDLTAIQGDEPVGQRPYQPLPETKKKSKPTASESAGYGIALKDGDERTDEEAEGPYSDDEMLAHKGLRRSQSMKSVKTIKGRKEVRYGSLKYKVKKRPQVYF
ncbi:receptor expression-enhancing protein 3 isoform X1 [Erinaceus europaeus]|uniref:Receptor expression-enhancing protein 3 isoform X1 n=1 Tax=Erinaceus europaeus TaxID=9365 RepID=A0ABM3XJZ4_ERIEU|nr:receptor expression-enhancing protein 3 isoform X1 [Erinaceus europaeus]